MVVLITEQNVVFLHRDVLEKRKIPAQPKYFISVINSWGVSILAVL